MTESTDDKIVTLASRLVDESRSISEQDLIQITTFLYETLGRWYESKPGGQPPSAQPSNITIKAKPSSERESGVSLLDEGDTLEIESAIVKDGDETEEGDKIADGEDLKPDERDGVFAASVSLVLVALGRDRADDESWDDVVQHLETDRRPALASALWVGLATEPEARYPTIGQWRRSVDAAIRSDAATTTMLDSPEERSLVVPLAAGLVALAVLVGGAFVLVGGDGAAVEEASATTTEPAGATIGGEGESDDETGGTTSATVTESSGEDTAEGAGDACALVGPLGPITVDQVSDVAIVVAWSPSTESVDISLDGAFADTVPPEAFRYVIEWLPLSDQTLVPDTDYTVAVEPQSGGASTTCATTLSNPVPGSEALIGVTAPTGLDVVDSSATSITVGWDPRAGADSHNLYLDGTYLQFGDVGGSSTIGDETEFTFLDLDPGTTYEIGIRRIEGPNQSGIVSITATTESG